ncbi:MAG: hypothetical protein A4E20_11060 [Nitrospira sp. SG-bin2]|uniref:replicative DNA helicase n=1 Tax=Nitrospira cf. moscoviensis SBR1015 TaxID=96242 RepID=UPI000A0C0D9D|nr:replicative DNA helicase [Nitrospira cf. moscoviensis SBR1015]OQW34552.1 MAG: hypothetical protein A4E20_11060 [Nitrospira sp. SG-bin2]
MGRAGVLDSELQTESTLLGTLILFPATIPDVVVRISGKDFYHPRNELIFDAIAGLFSEGNPVSATSVLAELDRRQVLTKAGGAPYLTDLIQVQTTGGDAKYYCDLIFNKARLRRINDLGNKLIQATELDADEAVLAVHKFVEEADIDNGCTGYDFDSAYQSWTEWYDNESVAIPTPWPGVNHLLYGGWHRGRLYTITGRPGAGKSALCLNAMLQAARAGYRSVVYSLEMGREECMSRTLSAATSVPLKSLFMHRLTADEKARIDGFASSATRPRMRINDNPSQTIESIVADCRSLKKRGLDLVAVDHSLLLAPSDKRWALHQQVNHVAAQCKLLSKKMDCAVLLLHQMNRGREGETRKPLMKDLREGAEMDSDVILALTRDTDMRPGEIDVSVLKNRMGPSNATATLLDELNYGRLGCFRQYGQ